MDNTLNTTIIEKVAIKKMAIYKAIAMLPPPETKDLWAEKNSTEHLNNYENKSVSETNDTMNDTKMSSTQNDLNDTTKIKSGIYKIVNKNDGKYYVGRSANLNKRWRSHRNNLRLNKHCNIHLQNAWNKYGESSFEFIIVELLKNDETLLIETEKKYIDKFIEDRKNGTDNSYNISDQAYGGKSFPGNKFRKGILHSLQDRQKISNGLKGNTNTKGKKISEVTRQKIIKNSRKGINNPAYNHKIYSFYNKKTNEYFTGTLNEIMKKENIKINSSFHRVIRGIRNQYRGWTLIKS